MHLCSPLSAIIIGASLCLVQGVPVRQSRRAIASDSVAQLWTRVSPHNVGAKPHNLLPDQAKTTTQKTFTSSCQAKANATVPVTNGTVVVDTGYESPTSKYPGNTTPVPNSTDDTGTGYETPTSKYPGNSTLRKSCYPALDFERPDEVPDSLEGWWCDTEDEYAFLGFSYDISACQSPQQLNEEFQDARDTFNSRYIRLYGACDQPGYYDQVIEAAWNATLGVQALIWFGFDGDDKWKGRKETLFKSLMTNPKAKYVTRALQFGSEPLFDYAIDPRELAKQVTLAKKTLSSLEIPVTVSELAYGFQSRMKDGSQDVLDAIDFVDAHMLPYFAQNASTGGKAWYNNLSDMGMLLDWTNSEKKIIWSQNGWPSTHYCPGVCPNSPDAVSSVKSERAYYNLLDSKCPEIKQFPKGGVGWFAHLYSDDQQPGYGLYDYDGKLKFDFNPRTEC